MKTRKALNKAMKERKKKWGGTQSMESPAGDKNGEKPGWISPEYSESSTIKLDRKLVVDNRCICIEPSSPEIDSYKILRTQIQQILRETGRKTIMVTSALPQEGKTVTSINTALTFAKEFNQTVLLVDCDLRRQNIHEYLGYSSPKGLVDYLTGKTPLNELIAWPGIEKLTIISGGKRIQDSSELLGSPKMKTMVEEIKNRYNNRLIIFDAPPVLVGADAIAFSPLVDCILMVVEKGRTAIQDIEKALELLPQEKVIGFVLNRDSNPIDKYGYYDIK